MKSSIQPPVGVIDGAYGTNCLSSATSPGLNGSIPVRSNGRKKLGCDTYMLRWNDILGAMNNKQVKRRRRVKHILTLLERLEVSAQFARARAEAMPDSREREGLLKKAKVAENVAELERFLTRPAEGAAAQRTKPQPPGARDPRARDISD
ncbi:hypothetical protein [Bradyrhizobium iriomotense]|uniref:Uncharacterized protein n=1 Tax=Bradyrhizobium iriomotense TaxID=441950 RepID=A0ABQ6B7V0_9BRAD|nr:hypothetical protein [Bradyrhizobium iriomotense]GLR89745.1 hypothetical protein GCM10007857_64590 [Bradyrhizobium iriomotense]